MAANRAVATPTTSHGPDRKRKPVPLLRLGILPTIPAAFQIKPNSPRFKMSQLLTVQCKSGPRSVPAVWQGATLAIHHPITTDGTPSTESRWWAVTHKPTGLMACPAIDAPVQTVKSLARLWDTAFAALDSEQGAAGWPLASRWLDDVSRANRGRPIIGPRELTPLEQLDSAGTVAEINAAVRAAFEIPDLTPDEAEGQYPIEPTAKPTGSGAVRKNPYGVLEYWWLPRGRNYSESEALSLAGWYEVPCMADIDAWVFDSCVETPCGDSVEPDHPDSWLRLLGVV